MKNENRDVINFMRNRSVNENIRLYVDKNLRKEYITYFGYKKAKNDFEATLIKRDNRIGTLLCDFLNCDFESSESVNKFVEEYSISLLTGIVGIKVKNVYTEKEYQSLIDKITIEYGEKLQTIKVDFIDDITYLFNIEQLDKIYELTPLQRFYVLTLSKNKSKALSYFDNNKINIALGDLSRLNEPLNVIQEENAIAMAVYNEDKILPIPYTFESVDICQLLMIVIQEIVCMDKFEIKKCKNCGKYFVPEKRTDELYCNNIYEDGKTCKQIGAFKVKQKMIHSDDLLRTYRNVYQKLLLRTRRNPDNKDFERDFENFREETGIMRKKLYSGKVTYEEYMEWLNGK